jgi:hypothetical protein
VRSVNKAKRIGSEDDLAREAASYLEDPEMVRARGRAPRNFQRSNQRLREDICERLMRDHRIECSDVSVEVRDGTVVLEGTVPERRMKYMIEDTAAEVLGANDVDNRIRVAQREDQLRGTEQGWRGGAFGASTSELGNVTGVSGTTGRPAPLGTPPAGPREENLTGPGDRVGATGVVSGR